MVEPAGRKGAPGAGPVPVREGGGEGVVGEEAFEVEALEVTAGERFGFAR